MKKQKKLYHLLYYKDTNTFKLSDKNVRTTSDKLRVTNKKITEKQADVFVLHFRKTSKKKQITDELIQNIYKEFYYECNVCGKVYRSNLYRKMYKNKCRECYADKVSRVGYNRYHRIRHEKLKAARMKEYMETTHGKVNKAGLKQIRENIKYVAAMNGYTYQDISNYIGIEHSVFVDMMRDRWIDLDTVYKICEFLQVPIKRLTRKTMFGAEKEKTKNGIPLRIWNGIPQYKE